MVDTNDTLDALELPSSAAIRSCTLASFRPLSNFSRLEHLQQAIDLGIEFQTTSDSQLTILRHRQAFKVSLIRLEADMLRYRCC